ncbi:DNA polymerase IV [Alkalicoccus saliphilus]|jgi:DNA polymerase IV|uniref:DNA polymerase IV n=1 Tax=Alkalicoccus saliphilus TaxID=200989 RepID=A0A2T4UAL7_9BACI|nr:DNA polymerase IV [Alkalicoccus saliphilus]PTL40444.1 DNA polymerase IV [Alkalicoccus saliphilus]
MGGRVIFHVDMNSFYASVETADNPELKGKPLAIAGNAKKRKGIVVTASYEARARGVKPPVPLWEARRACRDLIVREPRFERYREKSRQMFELLNEYTEMVEPVSIDEGYMDVSDCIPAGAPALAEEIQQRLLKELGLPSSIGIAPNKFLAKTASDMKKPMGITVLRKREIPEKLWTMPAAVMHGIGDRTAEKLAGYNIYTIGDIAAAEASEFILNFGEGGRKIHERAWGKDTRPVDPEAAKQFKSIGHSRTLAQDAESLTAVRPVLIEMAESVSRRLKRKAVYASGLQLTIRYSSWDTIQRSIRLPAPLDKTEELLHYTVKLWEESWNGNPVRLVGITGTDLIRHGEAHKQLNLFSYEKDKADWEKDALLRDINEKYGENKLRRGFGNSSP